MIINGIQVQEEILSTKFACDYAKCKGFCCRTDDPELGEFEGAELDSDEASLIESMKVQLSNNSDRHSAAILKAPTYINEFGEHHVSMDSKGECVLCNQDGCVLSKLHKERDKRVNVPIGCHLYPLYYDKDQKFLRILDDYGSHCDCGYEKGEQYNIYLVDFCKDAIIRVLGAEFFDKLHEQLR